jgi:hypothetical protein
VVDRETRILRFQSLALGDGLGEARGKENSKSVVESARAIGGSFFRDGSRSSRAAASVVRRLAGKKKKRFRRAARLAILAIPTLDFYG